MLKLIKQSLLTGLGIAVVAKEKLEKTVKNLVAEGKMNQEEAEKLLKELMESGESQWQDIEKKIKQLVREATEGLAICSKQELDALRDRVAKLEEKVDKP